MEWIATKFEDTGRRCSLESRHPDKNWWVVADGRVVLGKDLQWDYEPLPSNRTDEWLENFRYDLETAKQLAEKFFEGKDDTTTQDTTRSEN